MVRAEACLEVRRRATPDDRCSSCTHPGASGAKRFSAGLNMAARWLIVYLALSGCSWLQFAPCENRSLPNGTLILGSTRVFVWGSPAEVEPSHSNSLRAANAVLC